MQDPHKVYDALLAQRRAAIAQLERQHANLGYFRLAIIAAAVAVAWWALSGNGSIFWVVVPGLAFVALAVLHERRLKQLERRKRAAAYFEKGLARLNGDWAGTGEPGTRYADPAHPYAIDLDLFGKGSLFELISTARTHIGEDTLANWLLKPALPATVVARQGAVEELRPRLDLREQLSIVAEEARTGVDPIALAAWGEEAPKLQGAKLRVAMAALQVLGMSGLIAGILLLTVGGGFMQVSETQLSLLRILFVGATMVNGAFYYRIGQRVDEVVAAVEQAAHELNLLSEVLTLLEAERFESPMLAALRASLDSKDAPPSKQLARLRHLVEYLDSRDNVIVRATGIYTLWAPHWAFRVEDWRRRSGPAVRHWLTALGEIEALCSFASHAFEHPADPFPEFSEQAPWIDAEEVAHPLIPEGRSVRNSVRIGGELRVLVVSGSNMSGKSTLLRTLGSNVVLAQAGAPVRAKRLVISRLAVGASIRVSDSLQGGVSHFYAEILRLRQILDETEGPLPVLFLIDEFLHGTNSHDRKIAAESMVAGLAKRGAIGLITTHDLALASIAEALGERAANVHFEDSVEDGKIHFDYRMRPGVVRKSNAIELMRSVGIEI